MKYHIGLLFLWVSLGLSAQKVQSPSEYLGYELGTQFTYQQDVIGYYQYLQQQFPDQVKLVQYGKTYERRPLYLAFVSSPENMANLETIRQEHMKGAYGEGNPDKAIVWLSYNVHGNESVSTEASMKTLYTLLTQKSEYLKNLVVVMDPCVNPDGRERYVVWYNQHKNTPFQPDPNSLEHHEGWPNGRSNHYMFDLNRDWAWLTQTESQQRIKMFNQWLPHVHVDFHEQGVDAPYYFAPAAEPYHEVITPFQRSFQETMGKNHAKYFDANGWFYFTKEIFDLLYPSYGDTYPLYNGSIGMTYEQGGSGRAGLAIARSAGDTLTLQDRIAHHFTTGLSTLEVASQHVDQLNQEFKKYHLKKDFKYKSYVLQGNSDNLRALEHLLQEQDITYGFAQKGQVKGFDYESRKNGSMTVDTQALVVPTNQPKGTLVKVLFEPNTKLTDSLTYDITAWSLPYAYGLQAMASETEVGMSNSSAAMSGEEDLAPDAYAYLTDWNSMEDAQFLADLLQKGIRVRKTNLNFTVKGKTFAPGSLIIAPSDNKQVPNLMGVLKETGQKFHKTLVSTPTGFVDAGKDFGSEYVDHIPHVKVAVLSGEPTSSLAYGEIWHFFEQQLHYPVTALGSDYFDRVNLDDYHVLILPDGGYTSFMTEDRLNALKAWVAKGGKLIAMGGAISSLEGEDGFDISTKKQKDGEDDAPEPDLIPNADYQREQIKNEITGAIFKVKVDNTHPLAYGYGKEYYTLKLGSDHFDYLSSGNVAYLENNTVPVDGFAGSEARKKIANTLIFGVESHGRGSVIYMVDDPLFRAFWQNGKLFFANALFMVN